MGEVQVNAIGKCYAKHMTYSATLAIKRAHQNLPCVYLEFI